MTPGTPDIAELKRLMADAEASDRTNATRAMPLALGNTQGRRSCRECLKIHRENYNARAALGAPK